ncbi:MAG TPA: hypothetical protein ENK18_23590 [Deltaproteobacteria bacterium]|nr:hypothetical protein [Deltaproteobacteria bacterium]
MKRWATWALGLALPNLAAGACERQLRALERSEGMATAEAYRAVAACDPSQAVPQLQVALKRAKDIDSIAALSIAAIEAEVIEPVHALIEEMADYDQREAVVRAIGAGCGDPAVLAFVRDLHDSLKGQAFVSWGPALGACPAPEIDADLEALAKSPPAQSFDNKYGEVVRLYGERHGADALPLLQGAAVAAASSGPFTVVLDAMVKAVTPPGFGSRPEGADLEALVSALLGAAAQVEADQAGRIADILVNLEQEEAAATLLPQLHAGKEMSGGGFRYGVAAIEACGDAAVVHWALVEDPQSRWSILEAVDGPARSFRPKIKGCDSDSWEILVTPAPVADTDEIEAWLEATVEHAGLTEPRLKSEKKIRL